ncbi:hypothetical protein [Archangium sp.]|uniref:hypothetical protein n=1 Tax=Archangium sp. TaxID=1872627 RepID=UPI002EDAEFC0
MKQLIVCLPLLAASATTPLQQAMPASGFTPAPEAIAPAVASAPRRPVYTFGGVEVFGSRKVPKEQLLALIEMPAPGTPVESGSEDFIRQLIESKKRVTSAHAFAQCTFSVGVDLKTNIMRLTVDLVDAGDEWRMRFSPAPQADVADPDGLLAAWGDYVKAYWKLENAGALAFGFGACQAFSCYGRFDHPELAPREARFLEGVPRHFDALVRVLREDRDEGKRMGAVNLLAYGPSREQVVQAVLPSVRDPAQGVRNEVMRLLGAAQQGQPRVLLPLDTVLESLWLPTTADRNKTAWALVRILETEGAIHRKQILDKAAEPLLEMVAMQQTTDREPAHKVLTLLAGRDLGEDGEVWRQWIESVRGAEVAHTD